MRHFLAAAVAALSLAASAQAAYTFTTTRSAGPVANTDRVNFVISDNSGTLTVSIFNITVNATGGLYFTSSLGQPNIVPTALANQLNDAPNYGSFQSFAGFGGADANIPTPPGGAAGNAYYIGNAQDPTQGNPLTFNVAGFFAAPGLTLSTADIGSGLIFASAVVPTGTAVSTSITVNSVADVASATTQVLNNGNVPEPTSLALLGLGATGMLARRRRA